MARLIWSEPALQDLEQIADYIALDDPSAEKRYPDFRHALGTHYVCDAVLESAKTKQWVDVKIA